MGYADYKAQTEDTGNILYLGLIVAIGFVIFAVLGEPFINFWNFTTDIVKENITTMKFFVILAGIIAMAFIFSFVLAMYEFGGAFYATIMLLLIYNIDYMITGESKLLDLFTRVVLYLF